MIADVVAAGCRYVQLDFPVYPFLCDPDWRARMERHGYDWKETLELAIWADREVIADLPDHVRTGIHVCRGNNQSRYVAEGALDPVAEALFSLPYDSFLIEWEDQARMGDYSALRHVPAGDSVVVLGIVSSKLATLETEDELLRELDQAAQVPRSGAPRDFTAVRLRLHAEGQSGHRGRPVEKARARRRHCAALLVLSQASDQTTVASSARTEPGLSADYALAHQIAEALGPSGGSAETPMTFIPADRADFMPLIESSITTHCAGTLPSRSAVAR